MRSFAGSAGGVCPVTLIDENELLWVADSERGEVSTPPNTEDLRGESHIGDGCPRKSLPKRNICENSVRLRKFRRDLGGTSSGGWRPSRMAVAISSLKLASNDCGREIGSTPEMLDVGWRGRT